MVHHERHRDTQRRGADDCIVSRALAARESLDPILRNELHALVYRARLRGRIVSRDEIEAQLLDRVCAEHRPYARLALRRVEVAPYGPRRRAA